MGRRNRNEPKKITHLAEGSLLIETRDDEIEYRTKYLPDPLKVADAKFICTVCTKSLCKDVRTGKAIFGHMFLSVLICQECFEFYGNGVFSADEDGDEKYCRWCGQGGTLSLCSVCTCGFCMKCLKRNLKPSTLAKVEEKDWKCLICFPRPIYGSRAILWAAQQINTEVNEKYCLERKIREIVKKEIIEKEIAEAVKRGTQENSSAKNDIHSRKRKHRIEDSDDSSLVLVHSKKAKLDTSTCKSINGFKTKHKRKLEKSTSESENSDRKETDCETVSKTKKQKHKKKKKRKSSSENSDHETVIKKEKHKTKKKRTYSSESDGRTKRKGKKNKHTAHRFAESSDDGESSVSKDKSSSKKHKNKKHRKNKKAKKDVKDYSSDSETELYTKKKLKKKKKVSSSDESIDNDEEQTESLTIHKQLSSSEDETTNTCEELKEDCKQDHCTASNSDIVDASAIQSGDGTVESVSENQDAQSQDLGQPVLVEAGIESQQTPDNVIAKADDGGDEMKENLLAAVEFLNDTLEDISEVSTVISEQAHRFYAKKINMERLNSYDDVLGVLSKVKQLMFNGHKNYMLIEKNFEERFNPWKVLVGLEKPEIIPSAENNTLTSNSSEININETLNSIQQTSDENNPSAGKVQGQDSCANSNSVTCNVGDELPSPDKGEENGLKALITESTNVMENGEHKHGSPIKCDSVNKSADQENNIDKVTDFEQESSNTVNEDNENVSNICLKQSTKEEVNIESVDSSHIQNCDSEHISHEKDRDLEKVAQQMQSETSEKEKDNNISENNKCEEEKCVDKNFEALQEMLETSSDDETKSSKGSDSDDSSEINLDDSDLEEILKPNKSILKKPLKAKKKKKVEENELKVEKEQKHDNETVKQEQESKEEHVANQEHEEKENEKTEDKLSNDEKEADDETLKKETEKHEEDKLDSEAEIDMLTDLTKLKKKPFARKWHFAEDSEEDSDSSDESEQGVKESSRKGMKYKNESKKRREEERKELFAFLEDSNTSNEAEVTKKDLDVLEEQYVTASDSSMSLGAFSQKMNAKWKELEKEQEVMNLQMLLASDSDEGSVGGDDLVLSDNSKKKKKSQNKKTKEENNEPTEEKEEEPTDTAEIKEEQEIEDDVTKKEEEEDQKEKVGTDNEYEQFMEGLVSSRTKFRGLGSSSEDDIDIKDEPLDDETDVKKEPAGSDVDGSSSADDSDSSVDLFLDKSKSKSLKKKTWRSHRLLRMKLSDTDTSDEERWWQRRLAREKKKENDDSDRAKTSRSKKNKEENSSDKENKKEVKEEDNDDDGSSTLEISSTESSGSSVFRKKKKKKKADSSDSDVIILSEDDKKKKKKKKKRQIGESSNDSSGSEDDLIDISQKSTQGESPGKGGRKNIRKVKTKHELAAATKAAAKEEEERKKRIAARQKLFNEMFEIKEAEILSKLVLDFDPDTKTELISVDKDLVTKMKPHQAKGVKFMWDSCFESLSQLQTKKGSGCILAHCMGLGKTFQVISLVHTILKHKDTRVKTVLVVCPLSTVLNWQGEFRKWLDDVAGGKDIKTHHLTNFKKPHERARQLTEWHNKGGVMILGYEMFRNLTNQNSKLFRMAIKEAYQKTLIDPGADLVVCDEGHMLKNESTILSKAMSRIRTLRRIVLTGTPMQNNLKEYHCMVQFVKPNLLGTRKEFLNQFVNPITNGQFVDSTETDVKVMKRRAHVLHKMLEGLVQRFDYSVLTPFLPPKHEYVISVRLSDVQVKLYQFYLQNFTAAKATNRTGSQLFQDWQALGRIWTHPLVLKWKAEKEEEKRKREESEEESVKNSGNDKSPSLSLSSGSSSSSDDDGNDPDKKEKKKEDKKKQGDEKIKNISKKPDEAPALITPGVIEMEINLISSEEDEVNEIKEDEKIDGEENTLETERNVITEENDPVDDKEQDIQEDQYIHCQENQEEKLDGEKDESREGEDKENKDEKEDTNSNKDKEEDDDNSENVNGDLNTSEEAQHEEKKPDENPPKAEKTPLLGKFDWWKQLIDPEDLDDINKSAKLILLFAILRECEMIEDKILVFSQSLFSLDLIEYFLEKIDRTTKEGNLDESLGNHAGLWTKGRDYFRLDGSSSSENRSAWCKAFNREDNTRARLFLISTRAGGLGINLTAANRVVIFDASWNPSHDVQSIFRIYRFGQKKPCYVYRFIAHGTMEEKVYERQVAKQSLSSRVVDEQQVHRHFSSNDLNELYTFTPPSTGEKETPVLPKDRLMAELLTQYNEWVEKYHEHDSLLENVAEEQLNEEERQLAWEDYENDKKRGFLPTTGPVNFGNFDPTKQMDVFRLHLKNKFPNASEQEMNQMLQTLMQQVYFSRQAQAKQQAAQTNVQSQNTSRPVGNGSNLSAQQKFNLQRNHLYQKYGEEMNANQMIGNAQIKRNQNINSARSKDYQDQMRMQHQISLARVQNQMRIQQAMEQKQRLMSSRGGKPYPVAHSSTAGVANSNNQGAWKPQPSATTSGQTPQLQSQKQFSTQVQGRKQLPTQVQGQKQMPKKLLNNRQLQVTHIQNKVNQPAPKTQQQLRQEQMRQSIIRQQQKREQKQVVNRVSNHRTPAMPDAYKRQLEEMKNRYKASRMSSNDDVSIVEIDDEPPTPSGSSA